MFLGLAPLFKYCTTIMPCVKFHVLSNSERDCVTCDGSGAMQALALKSQFNGSGFEDKFSQSLPEMNTQPRSPEELRPFYCVLYPFQS
jgi:hypothetical protein